MERNSPIDTLLICARFFGYAEKIKSALEKRGRHVAVFNDTPATGSLTKALVRVTPQLMRSRADAYFADIAERLKDQPVRDILVVKGEALSPAAIAHLRETFPKALFTLYFWDSYRNMPRDSPAKAALFDRVFTFDPQDVSAALRYRPLFFGDEFAALPDTSYDIDLLFFGTMHGDRFKVLSRLQRALPPTLKFRKILYLPAKWLLPVHAVRNPGLLMADRSEIIYTPIPQTEIRDLIARSRIIVDIERPVQTGYTMRTLEVLGARRKLITTNAQVAKADFYNPRNIAIVDRDNPILSEEFLGAPYEPPPDAIVSRYSLDGWLDDVLPSA
jgi:hypothetical protein